MTNMVTVNLKNDHSGHQHSNRLRHWLCSRLIVHVMFRGSLFVYWDGNPRLLRAALAAIEADASADECYFSPRSRIFVARSSGSLSHLPSIRKSKVTPNCATRRAAVVSFMARRPFSNRDQ